MSPGHADEGSWERTAVVIDVSTLRIFGCEGRCGESTCLVDHRTAAPEGCSRVNTSKAFGGNRAAGSDWGARGGLWWLGQEG